MKVIVELDGIEIAKIIQEAFDKKEITIPASAIVENK